jgi:hypothetical protein
VFLDLPAADDVTAIIERDDEPPPIQTDRIDPRLANEAPDISPVDLLRAADGEFVMLKDGDVLQSADSDQPAAVSCQLSALSEQRSADI